MQNVLVTVCVVVAAVYAVWSLAGAGTRLRFVEFALRRLPLLHRPLHALRARLDRPSPRVGAGRALRGIATACVDVSDGLLADLGHVAAASGLVAAIEPLCNSVGFYFHEKLWARMTARKNSAPSPAPVIPRHAWLHHQA